MTHQISTGIEYSQVQGQYSDNPTGREHPSRSEANPLERAFKVLRSHVNATILVLVPARIYLVGNPKR